MPYKMFSVFHLAFNCHSGQLTYPTAPGLWDLPDQVSALQTLSKYVHRGRQMSCSLKPGPWTSHRQCWVPAGGELLGRAEMSHFLTFLVIRCMTDLGIWGDLMHLSQQCILKGKKLSSTSPEKIQRVGLWKDVLQHLFP